VSASFAPRIDDISFNRLVNGLAGFVHAHRAEMGASTGMIANCRKAIATLRFITRGTAPASG
jgi:hypothetical protein